MNDETEPIPVVESRAGGRGARHARPEDPADRSATTPAAAERASRPRPPETSSAADPQQPPGEGPPERRAPGGTAPEAAETTGPEASSGGPRRPASIGHTDAADRKVVPADIADSPTDQYVPAEVATAAEPEPPARPDRRTRRSRAKDPGKLSPQRRALTVAGRIASAATAVVVVLGTGFVYYTERSVDQGFTRSNAISEQDAASLDGEMNILLIGLDTRKDQNGNDLPKNILSQLHAGDGQEGGYNANSLILVHIPKDLKAVTAFSIPRDDYVPVSGIPGYDHAKIKEAYGLKKASVEQKLIEQGVKDPIELERQGREAGRESILQNVKTLTGVPINRFAEISLVGFYDLANILGGVDVCLNHAVNDSYYSGAVFPAGPQHLDAARALSFVRQRHGLDNGDLDRTHRQQAFLTSVAKQLKDSGTLTDIGKLQALIGAAQKDIVLSQGWNLVDFASTMGKAGSVPIQFQTLPVKEYGMVDGQDVNMVDTALIRRTVRAAFGVQATQPNTPATTPTSTVDVVNAGAASGVAGKVSTALTGKGFPQGTIGNASYTDGSSSVVYYGAGADADADQAADMLGGLPTAASKHVRSGHVKIVVGSDFTMPDGLSPDGASSSSPTSGASAPSAAASKAAAPAAADPQPDSGKAVTTTIGSQIPCVN